MDIRERLSDSLTDALKAKNTLRLGTLRLINAAIKDRDIALRAESREVGDADILAILSKMVKQRQESIKAYEEGGRLELAIKERDEITVIEEFLPTKLDEAQTKRAVEDAVKAVEAGTIRDMGKVMGLLKSKYTGQIDFSFAGQVVKELLSK
ncbi:MAG: GatB/YqeY domain-containing protein [Paracoccaceae bacterium]